MVHRIDEKTQRNSKLNPGEKIDYWIDFIEIDDPNEILYVTSKNEDSHDTLRRRIISHRRILHAEDISLTFSVNENEDILQFIFSKKIKDSLDFLKEEGAFSEELYNSAVSYLKNRNSKEEKSCELHIPSITVQSSISNSSCLFSADRISTTPPTPPSDKKSCSI